MKENFRQIQDQLAATPDAQAHTAFLSISFEPQYDTPSVLRHYASIYDKRSQGQRPFDWQFAVPSAKDLPEIANFFGLVPQHPGAQIVHALSTTLVGPEGKVQQWYDTNDWNPSELGQLMLRRRLVAGSAESS